MCFKKKPKLATGTTIKRVDYIQILLGVGVEPISVKDPLDATITIASEEELRRIAPYLTRPADDYIAEIADCEDYAMWGAVKAAFEFHCSTVRVTLGESENGYHGYNIMVDTNSKVWILENNAGFPYAGTLMEIGEHGHIPKVVII